MYSPAHFFSAVFLGIIGWPDPTEKEDGTLVASFSADLLLC